MDRHNSRRFLSRWRSSLWLRVTGVFACLLAINLLAVGTSPVPSDKPDGYPPWWFQRDVISRLDSSNSSPLWNNHDYPAPDDYAVANLGQLKYIATQAAAELDAHLPGGAGSDIHNLVAQWAAPAAAGIVRDDYAALNLGQLKTVAKLFYDRLIAVHYTTVYPWAVGNADDFAVANLGQIKYLFSFDLTYSSLGDGVPDWWKLAAGLMTNDPNAISSYTGNATLIVNAQPITYTQAYQQGVDPIIAATANPAKNPPPGQGHPLQQLPTVTYAAIDVSSADTQEDVDLVALDDTGRVGFHYFGPSTDGSGSLDKGVSFFQGAYTVTDSLPDIFFLGPYSDYWTERYVQSVNASGQLAGEVLEEWDTGASAGSVTWAMVDANEYSPDGNGIFGDYFGGPVGVSIHLGNSGLAMGTGCSYNIEINPAGDQWIPSTNPSLTPSVFSPSGIAAGAYLTDSNGKPLNFAVGVFGSVILIDLLAPLALSDSGLVVGDDKSVQDDKDALSVWNGSRQRLSSLLPSAYANKIRFPRATNGAPNPEAWINNKGDIVVAAMVLDDSSPTATWVPEMLLWRNALNPDNTAPKSLSFVSIPANASRKEFNASAHFVGLLYEPATDHMAAALLVPVEVKKLDRDDPTQTWADGPAGANGPIYAGDSNGDMVSFKLVGPGNWSNATFTWSAEGPDNIAGPSGTGANEWKIEDEDGNDPDNYTWLGWAPGEYKIKCQIAFPNAGNISTEFDQEVAQRTEQYFVVGTIPFETEDTTGVLPRVVDQWKCPNIFSTGPAAIGGGVNNPQDNRFVPMDVPNRVYVNNRLLNSTRNFDPKPAIKPDQPLAAACGLDDHKHYRFFSGCQFKFRIKDNKLAFDPEFVKDNSGSPTKADIVGFTPFPCSQSNALALVGEKSPDSGKLTGKTGDPEFSYLSKNRVGPFGQNGWKGVNGRIIPWVFFRFRFEAKDDGLIDTRFDAGPSSDPNGPDNGKDYSSVPTILVYRRYYDLQSNQWKAELVRELDEQRRPFMSIGTPVPGAPYVIP